jgi:hypothetical protein
MFAVLGDYKYKNSTQLYTGWVATFFVGFGYIFCWVQIHFLLGLASAVNAIRGFYFHESIESMKVYV